VMALNLFILHNDVNSTQIQTPTAALESYTCVTNENTINKNDNEMGVCVTKGGNPKPVKA